MFNPCMINLSSKVICEVYLIALCKLVALIQLSTLNLIELSVI